MASRETPQPARRDRDRDRRRRKRRRLAGVAVKVAVVLALFAAGLAVGRVLDDNPEPNRPVTYVRTLKPPLQLEPAPATTVTVTRP